MAPKGQAAGLNASNILQGSRKRGRPDDEAATAAADQGPSDVPSSSTRRAAAAATGSTSATSSPAASGAVSTLATDPEQVTRLGYKLLNIIYHARDLAEEDDPLSLLVEPFLVLPDPTEYADYYQIIKRPLTYEHIRARLDRRDYATLEQVKQDCEIICINAKRYNLKDTPIWLKARALHSIIKDVYADLVSTPSSVKSTELDSTPALLDIDVEGVRPITSAPPSPAGSSSKAAGTIDVKPVPSLPPAVATPQPANPAPSRRITIKRKPSATPQTQTPILDALPPPSLPPTVAEATQGIATPVADTDADSYADMDAEGEADIEMTAPNTPSETPADKRRRPFGRGKNLKSAMKQWLNEIWDLKDAQGESVTDFFDELPDRNQLPEYYKIILEPISLKEINENVTVRRYRAPHAFFAAVRTMIANAKYYNEEGSTIWNDADVIEKHLDNKLIPMILSEGFTLDPNDTRSSVLPLGHRENSVMLASPAAAPQRDLTPVGASSAGNTSRLKVKIGPRPSAPGMAPGPNALSPSTSSAAESLIDLGIGGGPPPSATPAEAPRAYLPPNAGPAPASTPTPAPSYPGPSPPMHDTQLPQSETNPAQHPASSQTTASGRPMRSTSGVNLRNLGTPQTITGMQPAPQRGMPAGPGQSPPPHLPHPGMYAGGARSPPGPAHAIPSMGRPGMTPHGVPGGPPMRTPSGLGMSVGAGMRGPLIPPNPGGRFVPPSLPSSQHRESRPSANRINQLTTSMGMSPFQPPAKLGEKSAKPARDTSIPSFVVLSSGPSTPLRKVLKTDVARQFAISVDKGVEEVQILFRVKDYPPPGAPGKEEASKATDDTAMVVDGQGNHNDDAEGEADTTTTTTTNAPNKPQTFAEAPSRPPSPERHYKPQILTVYNGRYYSPRWSRTYPPPPHPHHTDPADIVVTEGNKKMKEYAMLTLPLHPGSNLLEISLYPAPPNVRLEKLAAGEAVPEEEDDGATAIKDSTSVLPPRTLRGHVNGSQNATSGDGDATAAAAEAVSEKAREMMRVGEGYRLWITRG